ncbi:Gamma-tubulin complex component protein [Trinorchestia longiramus]|nr:Gamma-tubulin complex component protein [Trinorchestia longiramus]
MTETKNPDCGVCVDEDPASAPQLSAVSEEGSVEAGSGGLTLRRLLLWTLEPRLRLRSLLHATDSARGLRGGALLSALYQHLQHGSPSSEAVVQHCLARSAAPLHAMLTQWLVHGTLTDPHQEFFIAADPTVSDHNLWHHKYSIRWCQLPSFVSAAEARQVLATGKSLNFLRSVCKLKTPMDEQDTIAAALKRTTVESLFSHECRGALQQLMEVTYRAACGRVLQEVLEQQQLLTHLRALRRYLLLGQGDFIHMLLQVLRVELCQPASRLYPHNLSSLLETAVAGSNARFDHPDTLRRLDVKLLQVAQGDTGWDVFSLDYHVDGPIGTVLTAECMQQYLMLFNSLWRAKHMECLLSDTWKQQAATTKLCRHLPEVQVVVHGVQLLLSEMIHLVHQLGYYMTFEVLEVSWDALMKALDCPDSLDCLIAAHNTFLARIVKGALLDHCSADVRTHLRSMYDLMLRLAELQTRLHGGVAAELGARHQKVQLEQKRAAEGQFSTSAAEEETEKQRKHNFSSRFVTKLKTELKILTQTYQDMVQSFLLMLAAHDDDNLQQLSSRLDFNEHYLRRDRRLRQRLTFHHKRKSLGGSKAAALALESTDKSDGLVC